MTKKILDREDFDPNEWGNIGKEEVFKKTSLELAWTKERKQKQKARHKDPSYMKTWKKKHKKAIKNRGEEWYKNVSEANRKKAQDTEFVDLRNSAVKNATQKLSWKQKHQIAVEKLAKDPNWQKALKQGLKKRAKNNWYEKNQQAVKEKLEKYAIKCQVKEPGKPWRTFIGPAAAAKYYNWGNLRSHAKKVFLEDGSIKTWTQGKTGWKTRRIID